MVASGYVNIAMENDPVEIVDLPIKIMVMFQEIVDLPIKIMVIFQEIVDLPIKIMVIFQFAMLNFPKG